MFFWLRCIVTRTQHVRGKWRERVVTSVCCAQRRSARRRGASTTAPTRRARARSPWRPTTRSTWRRWVARARLAFYFAWLGIAWFTRTSVLFASFVTLVLRLGRMSGRNVQSFCGSILRKCVQFRWTDLHKRRLRSTLQRSPSDRLRAFVSPKHRSVHRYSSAPTFTAISSPKPWKCPFFSVVVGKWSHNLKLFLTEGRSWRINATRS